MTDRRRNLFVLLIVAGLLVGSVAAIFAKPTRLGLDLKGGVSLIYQAKPTKQSQVTSEAIDRSLDIMRSRVDQLGVAEPQIQRSGPDQIDVSLPAVKNADEAANQVGTTAQMFFYDWEPNVLGANCKPAPADPNVTGGPSAGSDVSALSYFDAVTRGAKCPATNTGQESTGDKFYLVDQKAKRVIAGPDETQRSLRQDATNKRLRFDPAQVVKVPQGVVLVRAEQPDPKGKPLNRWYVLRDQPALRGTDIKNPEQNFDNGAGGSGQPDVTFSFTGHGRNVWQKVTREIAQRGQNNFIPGSDPRNAFQHFAIVLDNELISTPFIDFQQNPDGIDGANGSQISGGFTIQSAQRLANLLKTGALPIKLQLISSSQVSATLGKQALNQGLIAGVAGFLIVALFLLVFYRVLGMIAVGALVIYSAFLFALVKLIPITLTLPGIAGLILTIGVAADANIVIFERVKEELRGGRSIPSAIATGYKRGLSAIVDANVVTFMVAFILFILATAGVKGFAFTLGVGTLVSFFTAVMLTQAVLGVMGRSRLIHSPAALGAGKKRERKRFDYMGASKWFFSMSGVILLIGALALGGKGLKFGIDFESGTRVKTELVKPANENSVRNAIAPAGFGDAEIQRLSGAGTGGNGFQISTATLSQAQRGQVEQRLQQQFGVKSFDYDTIGPTFGQTVAKSAVVAIIASLLVISLYMALRFEWKYAVPVLIALMHDLLITAGVYSLLGREVTTSTVAALLTILGYSLYDTVIVFDRIRENVPRMPRSAFSQIVNRSMSEVITRSLATTFCTALPILALLLFGGDTLKDFAFALLVGVASGAYSSIFIASPVLTHWKEREPVYFRRRQRIAQANGGIVPAYAVATGGAPVDVAPVEQERPSRRLTEPDDPSRGVSRTEFDEMVRDLHADAPASTATAERDATADLDPEDLVLKDDKPKRGQKPNRPRNRRHGRSR
ncbi:MAG: SecD/SecF fusion protein [Solirubrobacteraceae bacterium]|jgi:SecD/SecF fusion protein|nr:SecD/SecF fusion protein [Solirubrobacteraceae bacterium]